LHCFSFFSFPPGKGKGKGKGKGGNRTWVKPEPGAVEKLEALCTEKAWGQPVYEVESMPVEEGSEMQVQHTLRGAKSSFVDTC
jgi:hypothetical protein